MVKIRPVSSGRAKRSYESWPVTKFQRLTNGKHKLRIVWELRDKPLRYGELKRAVNAAGTTTIAERVFRRELKMLVKCGLIERTAHASLVPKVEYSLTPLGSKVIPLIARIAKWGLKNLKDPPLT
jgi:DNA-binding HxlR family transcriptional regulator